MDMEKIDRELLKLVRMTHFAHEMWANHRDFAGNPDHWIKGIQERLTDEEFVALVELLVLHVDPKECERFCQELHSD